MKKEDLKAFILEHGDVIIDYRSAESQKLKYNVVTLDFSGYVSTKQNRAQETADTLLVFSWDTDTFRIIKPSNVVKAEPLTAALARSVAKGPHGR